MSKAIPNTTQVPNVILDEWMPKLKDTELRVLLVVVRQTLGWIENPETGARKEKDWISRYQLMKKAGRKQDAIAAAVDSLIKKNLIEALDAKGNRLDTAQDRQKLGGRIYYRFNTFRPPATIFDTFRESRKVGDNTGKNDDLTEKSAGGKADTTKETLITKYILATETSVAGDNSKKDTQTKDTPIKTIDRGDNSEESPKISGESNAETPKNEGYQKPPKTPITPKIPSAHSQFVAFWYENVKAARRIEKPIITGQDGRNLQRVLKIIGAQTLEQLGVYFLNHPSFKGFSPSISTFLSSGVLNGLQNRMANDPNFWHDLSSYRVAGANPKGRDAPNPQRIKEELDKLKAALAQKLASPYKTMTA